MIPSPNANVNTASNIQSVNTIPASISRNRPSDVDDEESYKSVTPTNRSNASTIPAPPDISRTITQPGSIPGEHIGPQPRIHQAPEPPPLELAQAIVALNRRLTEYETRFTAHEREITHLRAQNRVLEEGLQRAQENPPLNDQNNDADTSSVSSHSRQPEANNVSNALLERLIAAQESSNQINEEARTAERRTWIKAVPTKFPSLRCINSETIEEWYTRLIPITSREKCRFFYNHRASDVVPNGDFNPSLNALLFSELMFSLSPAIQDYIYSQPHLYNNRIAVIRDPKSSYETAWTQLEKDAHQLKWMQL